jgi:hypothetical protein
MRAEPGILHGIRELAYIAKRVNDGAGTRNLAGK